MVPATLLILPIINFAVAAPVLEGKKSQAGVDAAHIPAINMLGKRVSKVDEMLDALFGQPESPPESPPPSKPADGWSILNRPLSPIPEEPSPEPNQASPTANTDLLMESPSPLTPSSTDSFTEDGGWWDEDENGIMYFGQGHDLTAMHAPPPNTNPRPSDEPEFNWGYWSDLVNQPLPKRPKPASSDEFGQAQEYQPKSGPSSTGPSNPTLPIEPVVDPPPPNLVSPEELDAELQSDHQSLSTDSQPVDPQAALTALKGKAKVLRRVPGTARDVGIAVQRELQSTELFDLGE